MNEGSSWPELFLFLSCPHCGTHFLLQFEGRRSTNEAWVEWGEPRYLYPKDETGVYAPVPEELVASYEEAHRAFHHDQRYRASAVECRRTLDLLCSNEGEAGRNSLQKKLLRLKNTALLDPRMFAWADELLRPLGNAAAHGSAEVPREDARAALELTKAILLNVYVLEAMYEASKGRRGNSG